MRIPIHVLVKDDIGLMNISDGIFKSSENPKGKANLRAIKASYASILIIILPVIIIPAIAIMNANSHFGTSSFAYGEAIPIFYYIFSNSSEASLLC